MITITRQKTEEKLATIRKLNIGFSQFEAGIVFCQLVIKLQLYSLCEIIILALDYNPLKHMDYNTSYILFSIDLQTNFEISITIIHTWSESNTGKNLKQIITYILQNMDDSCCRLQMPTWLLICKSQVKYLDEMESELWTHDPLHMKHTCSPSLTTVPGG